MRRYSKQREAIKRALSKANCHRSASEIYLEVKKEIPNISLGTVYRNLNELKAEGEILTFNTGGGEYFDGNPEPHFHFYCRCCGKTEDVFIEAESIINAANGYLSDMVDNAEIVFSGICKKCKDANKSAQLLKIN